MELQSKFAIVVADDLAQWQKLNVVAFLTSGVRAALYIQDMFETGHDAANPATVTKYASSELPLVGLGIKADKRDVDKVFKGAKLHD